MRVRIRVRVMNEGEGKGEDTWQSRAMTGNTKAAHNHGGICETSSCPQVSDRCQIGARHHLLRIRGKDEGASGGDL